MFAYVHHVAYVVDDMNSAIAVFRDTFDLELTCRRIVDGSPSFEMAVFKCGPTNIELQRPIDYPELEKHLKDRGPGLTHVAFAVKDLPQKIEKLGKKGIVMKPPGAFVAGTGWTIANFDLDRCQIPFFQSEYHDDHLAEAD